MFKNISKKRLTILLVSLLSVVAISVGVTLAYVLTRTDEVENEFKPSKVACAVVENGSSTEHFDDQVSVSTKSDVKIKNTGDTDAYIRVAVVVTWKNKDGVVWASNPGSDDYSITYDLSNGWALGTDGFYYYTSPVKPTELTNVLISSASQTKTGPVGTDGTQYYLSVEIVASAIQAKPTTVVTDQWKTGVSSVNGTTLVIKEAA